jgi:hypothetical protein
VHRPKKLKKSQQLTPEELELARAFYARRTLLPADGVDFWIHEQVIRGYSDVKRYYRLASNSRAGILTGLLDSRELLIQTLAS